MIRDVASGSCRALTVAKAGVDGQQGERVGEPPGHREPRGRAELQRHAGIVESRAPTTGPAAGATPSGSPRRASRPCTPSTTRVDAAQDALVEPLSAAERAQLSALLHRMLEHHHGGRPAGVDLPAE